LVWRRRKREDITRQLVIVEKDNEKYADTEEFNNYYAIAKAEMIRVLENRHGEDWFNFINKGYKQPLTMDEATAAWVYTGNAFGLLINSLEKIIN